MRFIIYTVPCFPPISYWDPHSGAEWHGPMQCKLSCDFSSYELGCLYQAGYDTVGCFFSWEPNLCLGCFCGWANGGEFSKLHSPPPPLLTCMGLFSSMTYFTSVSLHHCWAVDKVWDSIGYDVVVTPPLLSPNRRLYAWLKVLSAGTLVVLHH